MLMSERQSYTKTKLLMSERQPIPIPTKEYQCFGYSETGCKGSRFIITHQGVNYPFTMRSFQCQASPCSG